MAGGGAEADDDGVVRGGGGLETGGHAAGVGGVDAAIGFAGEEEDGWVGGAVFDVVEGRVGVEGAELVGIPDGTEFGDIEGTVRVEFDAEHVVEADVGDDGASEGGVLGEEGTHEEPTVAAAFDGEFVGLGVAFGDEVPGAGGEVVEDILFSGEIASEVPILAEFAAAADVSDGVDAAAVEPEPVFEIEGWPHAVAVAAVGVEEGGVGAVEFCAFAAEDADGDSGAVLADGEFADGFDVAEVDGRGVVEGGFADGAGGWVAGHPCGWCDEAGEAEDDVVVSGEHAADARGFGE